ncbi:hypothetical protein DFQ28_002349 [Apophysomyces sp. BC1034]|nr:hypothetical protein DFQ28_002349 [Apophysomyces sp. BC1034]
MAGPASASDAPLASQLALTSERVRQRMVERVRANGVVDERVLAALAAIPRHQFVDPAFAAQAYEDAALPIGHQQTISKPSVVARMLELALAGRTLEKVLEIGTGCGYQAAVLSHLAGDVYSIERVKSLYERAKTNLRPLRVPNIRLHYGDGRLGLPDVAPFDAIVIAAAGFDVPAALFEQLAIGGRLVAPVGSRGGSEQVLTLVERVSSAQWRDMLRSESVNASLVTIRRAACVAAALAMLTACSSRLEPAPVIDRGGAPLSTTSMAIAPAAPLGPPPPGYYRVKPGDTLYRVALENGQNYSDIAAWNNLTNPNQIEVDQLLRVVPPGTQVTASLPGVAAAPLGGAAVQSRPLGSPAAPDGASGTPSGAPPYGSAPAIASIPPQPGVAAGGASFAWPVRGQVLNPFNEAKNKGVNISGALGAPVKAAADGRVVYAGNGLRGYGNLIIIKHNATYLTAYAHNRALLVKEGDPVTQGETIAEMGRSDSDKVMLHFEVRKQGKPVDPLKYLPPQ